MWTPIPTTMACVSEICTPCSSARVSTSFFGGGSIVSPSASSTLASPFIAIIIAAPPISPARAPVKAASPRPPRACGSARPSHPSQPSNLLRIGLPFLGRRSRGHPGNQARARSSIGFARALYHQATTAPNTTWAKMVTQFRALANHGHTGVIR
jgi:hypothetical protein